MKEWLLKRLFKISNQAVNFDDLLEANALFNEGMLVDPAKLRYTLKTSRSYGIFGAFCALILVPLLLITHYGFTLVDFHLSIVSAVLVTAFIFIFYDIFKIHMRKLITQKLIKKAWSVHFPCFEYEQYSKIVEQIYKEALEKQIPKNQLEHFVLDRIVTRQA